MKIAFIVPYFGELPNYFQLFLESCAQNPEIDWLIISDDTRALAYPPNVHFLEMTFDACRERIQKRFDFNIELPSPQKLCDYKCAYGYLFEDLLTGYDWWGHCDLDQIFGKLSDYITEEMLNSYVKIGSLGHLTLYRNNYDNNRVFLETQHYRRVFSNPLGCGFDEWLPGNVNETWLNSGRPVWLENPGADLNPYRTTFQTVSYDLDCRRYELSVITNSIFCWENGILSQLWEENGCLHVRNWPYVHLQKRHMTDSRLDRASGKYYIIPNRFVDGSKSPACLLSRTKLRGLWNAQFFRVKWKSLQYRFRVGDWRFSSVFRQ